MGTHLIENEFQSDKYPTTPRGKVPLSVKDVTAQDLLWEYAQRRRSVDAEFSDDLETALKAAGFVPGQAAIVAAVGRMTGAERAAFIASAAPPVMAGTVVVATTVPAAPQKESFLDALRTGLDDHARNALEAVRDNTCFVSMSGTLVSLSEMDLIAMCPPSEEHTCGWRITAAGLHVLEPAIEPGYFGDSVGVAVSDSTPRADGLHDVAVVAGPLHSESIKSENYTVGPRTAELKALRDVAVAARALSAVMHDEKARLAVWWALDETLKALPKGADLRSAAPAVAVNMMTVETIPLSPMLEAMLDVLVDEHVNDPDNGVRSAGRRLAEKAFRMGRANPHPERRRDGDASAAPHSLTYGFDRADLALKWSQRAIRDELARLFEIERAYNGLISVRRTMRKDAVPSDLDAVRAHGELALAAKMLLMIMGDDLSGLDETEVRCITDLKKSVAAVETLSRSSPLAPPMPRACVACGRTTDLLVTRPLCRDGAKCNSRDGEQWEPGMWRKEITVLNAGDVVSIGHGRGVVLPMDSESRSDFDDDAVLSDMSEEDAALAAFVPVMRLKLFKNRYKGSWKKDAPHLLLARVCDELAEVVASMQPEEKARRLFDIAMNDLTRAAQGLRTPGPSVKCNGGARPIAFEAADVANMVMMVADVMGGLALAPAKDVAGG